jgi:hypothetical protein
MKGNMRAFDKRDNGEMHSIRLTGQVMSAEVWRQGRKQQDKYKVT